MTSRCTPQLGWTSRRRRLFKQNRYVDFRQLREGQIRLLTGMKDRNAAAAKALRWLLENEHRHIPEVAMKDLDTAFSRL
jgi:hypothetical protein